VFCGQWPGERLRPHADFRPAGQLVYRGLCLPRNFRCCPEPQSARRGAEHLISKGQNKVEFFRNTNIDFLGKKWYFLTFSLIFSVAGVLSMAFWHGIPLGVDFRGGTLVYVKYAHTPDPSAIHSEIERAGLKNARVQRYGQASNNEVLIALDIQETSEQALDKGKTQIIQALESHATPGKQDLNNSSSLAIANYLLEKDPLHLGSDANPRYTAIG